MRPNKNVTKRMAVLGAELKGLSAQKGALDKKAQGKRRKLVALLRSVYLSKRK